MSIKEMGEEISRKRNRLEISRRKLAEDAGTTPGIIRGMEAGNESEGWRPETLRNVCEVLGLQKMYREYIGTGESSLSESIRTIREHLLNIERISA